MSRWKFGSIGLLAILLFSIRAQSAEVVFPGSGTTWSVKISRIDPDKRGKDKTASAPGTPQDGAPSNSGQSAPADVERLEIKSGTNNVVFGTIYSSDGKKEIFYIANSYLMQKASNSDRIITIPAITSERDPSSLRVSQFPGLAWVAPSNFRGEEKKQGVDCKHYTHQEIVPGFPPINLEAWVRKSDGHPLICNVNDEIFFTYGEASPFPDAVILPNEFEVALEKRDQERAALDAIRKANERQASPKK